MRATAQETETSKLMGINVRHTYALTFALGGACAGVAVHFSLHSTMFFQMLDTLGSEDVALANLAFRRAEKNLYHSYTAI